jgi:hypothetical protein
MGFEDTINVFCLATPEAVTGLQWALEQNAFSDRRYRVVRGQLMDLEAAGAEYDLVLLMLDLGQPVPVENLRKLTTKRPGLCSFIQPTPGQLLALQDLEQWTAMAWDGSSYDKIARRLDELVARFEDRVRNESFLEASRTWLGRHSRVPARISWIDPPDSWKGPKQVALDPDRAMMTCGCLQSSADFRLPVSGSHDLFEFRFIGGIWSFKKLSDKNDISYIGDPQEVRAGDEVRVGTNSFLIGMDMQVEEIFSIARRFDVVDSRPIDDTFKDRPIDDVIRELLYSQVTGELQVSSGLKMGTVFVYAGTVSYAVTGAVNGMKALLRMLTWEQAHWRFNANKLGQFSTEGMRLDLASFAKASQAMRISWDRVRTFVPPSNVQLKVVAHNFAQRKKWTPLETKVVASISEFHLVRDILNYCPLPDMEIYETLIELRRQNLVQPYKPKI